MVLVTTPAPGPGASGSVRADTYSHNRFGYYVRNRTVPVNPNTARQQVVRSALSQLTVRWSQTLTQDQRDAWDLYGESVAMKNAVGQTVYLTGFNHYIRSNVPLIQIGGTATDDGPVIFELPEADPTLAITASEAAQQIEFTFNNALAWANETGGWMFKYQGKPQNPQRTFFGGPYRMLQAVAGDDETPPTSPEAQGVQFAIAEGQRQWAYCRIRRLDGRISEPFSANILVGA
ncbi:hypothetical protein ES703_56543 [subsurface metagenome]